MVLHHPFDTEDSRLKQLELVVGQRGSQGPEEGGVLGGVVEHQQHPRQQLIGHQEVVQIGPLVVGAAVAAAALHQRSEVPPVPGRG